MNKTASVIYLINVLLRVAAFVCITYAAIHFNNARVLWWYLAPVFMGISYSDDDKEDKK